MEFEKGGNGGLPPYTPVDLSYQHTRPKIRRSRVLRFLFLAGLAFVIYAQWRQLNSEPLASPTRSGPALSIEKLQADLAFCAKLRTKPQDPIGPGRERNARYINGHQPTLIKNATVWVGEPVEGTSPEDARAGKGYGWLRNVDVFLEHGLIKQIGSPNIPNLDSRMADDDYLIYNAKSRPLTSGIIDMHSHAGVGSLPDDLRGNQDVNEMSSDITPYVRSIDGLQPDDHQIQVIKSGGVTTSLILPGSGNNIGGEAFVIKHAVGRPDGREEISAADMLADPDRNWRYIKMACGENAKRVYGKVGQRGPVSRLGESYEFRRAFETAAKLVREQDDWCRAAETVGVQNVEGYLPQDLQWETLGAVLRGQVHVNTHCYTVPDLEAFVDHTNEFNFSIRAFHHAHQTYLVPEILKRAWGDSPPASALFADNMWYKQESYVGSEFAGKILYENGLTPIYVSDNPVLNAQHVLFEAAKAYGYGLPYHAALASVTTAPAERLGLGQRIGKIKPGFDADVVVWDSDPLSVGAAPVQVWIDGTAQFEDPIELEKPLAEPLTPDESLSLRFSEEADAIPDVIFTGISHDFLSANPSHQEAGTNNLTLAITKGRITCLGACTSELQAASASGSKLIHLASGHLTKPFVAFGSLIGLNAIDAEAATDNGASTEHFSRGVDGLRLDTKKLHYAYRYGVVHAISGPKFTGQSTHFGTSVGFRTGATHVLEEGAVWGEDVAVHYTLDKASKSGPGGGTISAALGSLRQNLLKAVEGSGDGVSEADAYTESAFLQKVVRGEIPLAFSVHSADGIASALQLKDTVEKAANASLKVVIIGGGESHLLASELAAANVGVVLTPLQSYQSSWDQRRGLTGAPLTNGTAVDKLVGAGVVVGIGLEEDWLVRDLGLLAGIAWKNGEGRLSQKEALDLAGGNIYRMLGLKTVKEMGGFLVFEGSPLEIGGRLKGVGDERGVVTVFE